MDVVDLISKSSFREAVSERPIKMGSRKEKEGPQRPTAIYQLSGVTERRLSDVERVRREGMFEVREMGF